MQPGTLSLIFFCIEFVILITVIIFNRNHKFFWSIIFLLVLLQLYQLSEFLICIGINENVTVRIAYVIITFLPPLGYFLCTRVVGWKYHDYLIGFALGLGFSLYYLIVPNSVQLIDCNPLYAIYGNNLAWYYGAYYIGMIVYSILFVIANVIWRREQIYTRNGIIVLIGYLSFLAPMFLMVLIDTSRYLPTITSIMCKYALVLAVILGVFSFLKKEKTALKDTQLETTE